MKKLLLLAVLLSGCSASHYTVVCKDSPKAHDVLGNNTKDCVCPKEGATVTKRGFWGVRTYYIDRCENVRAVRWQRMKPQP